MLPRTQIILRLKIRRHALAADAALELAEATLAGIELRSAPVAIAALPATDPGNITAPEATTPPVRRRRDGVRRFAPWAAALGVMLLILALFGSGLLNSSGPEVGVTHHRPDLIDPTTP